MTDSPLPAVRVVPQPDEVASELNAFFRLSGDLLAVADERLKLLHFNPAWDELLGHSTNATESVLDLVAPRDREKVAASLEQCLTTGSSRTFDAMLVRRNQQPRAAQWHVSADKGNRRLYLVVRDVTVRRRLERELAEAQKLEALGQLSSGVAHEINTPIQFVSDNMTFIGDALQRVTPLLRELQRWCVEPPSEERRAELKQEIELADVDFFLQELPVSLESIREGIDRVAELVRGLKEFAHPDGGQVKPTDLNRAIERALIVSRNEWKYAADVKTVLAAVPPVPCLANAINQVLLNLICNAAHAVEDRVKGTDQRGIITIESATDGHYATVSITDTGTGIPERIRARIFEPFFTTKDVGRGTGQGLAIAKSLIERHHGQLDFETTEGVGTTFRFRLPLVSDEPMPGAPDETRTHRR